MQAIGGKAGSYFGRRHFAAIWAAPTAVLFGFWLWAAFSSGAYLQRQWLPIGVALGLFGFMISYLVAYPRRPRQLSSVVLGVFALYSLWVTASTLWAASSHHAWFESGRTFLYLLFFCLALLYLTDRKARAAFRYLLMGAAFVILVASVIRLWTAGDPSSLFFANRFAYPSTYPNNSAALFLLAFWPLMWLAAGPEEKAPVRGVALGLATGLVGLAFLTQSRGAVWSLAITLILTFIVSPARLRTLFYLLVPSLLMVYEFPLLNRYWLDGPEKTGGGLAARTVVVAAIAAAFIGTILALLEKWVRVSRRMKAIFGSVILVGLAVALIYGGIAGTGKSGGPWAWLSHTWKQFTEHTTSLETNAAGGTSSRFVMVSSNGRMDIWRVAWIEFKSRPALGVGADNFVFRYDQLRTKEQSKPKEPHSLPLQVLAETGLVGGALAFGGMLLALGGILWPRCVSGWRAARKSWLWPRGKKRELRFCSARWGEDSLVYGWEMALLVALAYWLIHGSVEWLWQMPGITLGAFLMLAAALSSIEARVEVIWPRLSHIFGRRARLAEVTAGEPPTPANSQTPVTSTAEAPAMSADQTPTTQTGENSPLSWGPRRSDQYLSRIQRRRRRKQRYLLKVRLLQPPGPLSHVVRFCVLVVSLALMVGLGLPYLSLELQDSAVGLAKSDGQKALDRAWAAHWLDATDPGPYLTQAAISHSAARSAANSTAPDRAGAVLDNLALALSGYEQAATVEPADWSVHYRAGVAALNLLLASRYTHGGLVELDYTALLGKIPGLDNWSGLVGAAFPPPAPGQAKNSLAGTPDRQDIANSYRNMTEDKLGRLAVNYLEAAGVRNPLASGVAEAMRLATGLLQAESEPNGGQ